MLILDEHVTWLRWVIVGGLMSIVVVRGNWSMPILMVMMISYWFAVVLGRHCLMCEHLFFLLPDILRVLLPINNRIKTFLIIIDFPMLLASYRFSVLMVVQKLGVRWSSLYCLSAILRIVTPSSPSLPLSCAKSLLFGALVNC